MAGTGWPVTAPTPPDFHSCSEVYGTELWPMDCGLASGLLPHGQDPVTYRLSQTNVPNALELPYSVSHGGYNEWVQY